MDKTSASFPGKPVQGHQNLSASQPVPEGQYTEVWFPSGGDISPSLYEILIALLGDIGFESFQEDLSGLKAYIPSATFSSAHLKLTLQNILPENSQKPVIRNVPRENWNEFWESNFSPIWIDNRCYIRAPFHEKKEAAEIDIIIEPKMSFGTGHHETTSLMCSALLREKTENISVLDMGCGTGILGILAARRGASSVTGIDIDGWACENAKENCQRNHINNMIILQGDASLLQGKSFDLILANINRNILLQDFPTYTQCLLTGSRLLVSGILREDEAILREKALDLSMVHKETHRQNQWIMMIFVKS